MEGIVPDYILEREGKFTLAGLLITHNGRGRVVITDASSKTKMYSDSDYYSPSEVVRTIKNILNTR